MLKTGVSGAQASFGCEQSINRVESASTAHSEDQPENTMNLNKP